VEADARDPAAGTKSCEAELCTTRLIVFHRRRIFLPARMRPKFTLPLLALAFAACRVAAQEETTIRLAPFLSGPAPANPGSVARNILAAQNAQEMGFPSVAVPLYREAMAQVTVPSERIRLGLALATAQLDHGDVTEAEKTLNALPEPHNDSAWNLRAGLVAVQQRRYPDAGTHLANIQGEQLSAEDLGWWYFLQGRIADAANEAARAQGFYQQAEDKAVSQVQRTRFQLSRMEAAARSGPVSQTLIDSARQNAQGNRGTEFGFQINIDYASLLSAAGQDATAINVLRQQLPEIPPNQAGLRDKTLLQLGLIATTKSEAGRGALLQLLTEGVTSDSMRIALVLLANEPEAIEFRRRLDTLIARMPSHPIREDLLMKRAQLQAAEKTANGYIRATADARELLAAYPGSVLKAQAQALLATIEWEQRRYLGAANAAAEARAAATDPAVRARLGLMEAEAYFRVPDYRRAATAYDAVLRDRAEGRGLTGLPAGDLLFQRLQAEIAAANFSVPKEASDTIALLDRLAADKDFDVVNRWQAEWNLARELRRANQFDLAYRRVNTLLAAPPAAGTLPPDLRAYMLWLQAQLSLEAEQPENTIRLAKALAGGLANVSAGLAAEIRSTAALLQGRAELKLGREKEAFATFDALRRDFKSSSAAAASVLLQADYHKGKDQLAEAQRLLRRMPDDFPDSPYVPEALYRAALLDVDKKEAANRLNQLAKDYPRSPLVFDALLRQADLYRELNTFGLAQQIYQRLVLDYPNHPRAYEAEMGLADCYNAQATADPSSAERAAERYERLLDLTDVRLDLRVEAGFKLGDIRRLRGKPDEAATIWWRDVVTPFLLNDARAGGLGSSGRYWMGRTLTYLAELHDSQNRLAEARESRRLLVEKDLPGKEAAARQLATAAGAIAP
jgi:tetratricopeptide (TPR) repeat protein